MKSILINIFALCLPLLFTIGCSNNQIIDNESTSVNVIRYHNPETPCLDSVLYDVRFLPLQESSESHFFEVSQLYIDSTNIVIFDKFSGYVKKFNNQGLFVGNLGSKGQGPGEYSSIACISTYLDTIFVEDYNQKILAFSKSTGDLLYELPQSKTPPLIRLSKNRWAMMNTVDGDYQIELCDSSFSILKEYLPKVVNSGYLEYPKYRFYSFSDSIFAFPFHSDCIYYVSDDSIQLVKKIDFDGYSIIPPELYQEYSDMKNIIELTNDDNYVINYRYLENKSHFLTTYNRGSKFFLGVFDKQYQSTRLYSFLGDDLKYLDFIFYPSAAYGDGFVSVASVERLCNLDYCSSNPAFCAMRDTVSLESDVLIFWTLKTKL